jgi:Phosphorylase superfamily
MKPLLVVPTEREARALRTRKAFISGAGEHAYDAVRERLLQSRPGLVLIAGVCGGLDPSLGAGALILSRQVLAPGHDILDADRMLLEAVRKEMHTLDTRFIFSRLLTLDRPAMTPEEKRQLWNEHGAGGVDMETFHIARAAREAGVPWLALRAVVDTARHTLPRTLETWRTEGDERTGILAAAIRPADWPRYGRLARNFPRALQSIRSALPIVVNAARDARTIESLPMVEVNP